MRLGIQTKWALLNVTAVGIALGPASIITISRVHRSMTENAQESALSLAQQLAAFSFEEAAAPSGTEDTLRLANSIRTTTKSPDVRYAVIFRSDGEVIGSSEAGILNTRIEALMKDDGAAAARSVGRGEPDLLHLHAPILLPNSDVTIGGVRIGYSFAKRSASIRSFALFLGALNIAGLIAGVLLGLVFARRFASPIIELTALAQRVAKGTFEVSTKIRRTDEIGALAAAFNEMTAFLQRGKFMRHAFERYVSADLAERLDKNPDALLAGAGERKEVTILFLDIRAFTTMSEKMSAEEVVKFLVTFFNLVSEPVFQFEGAIDKFIGDAMLAVFGFPIRHDDDPLRAVMTGVRIQALVQAYNRDRMRRMQEPIGFGIGINTGPVVAGNVGCTRKLDYTVIGDAVNVASRICSLAEPGQLLVSGSTYEAIRSSFDTTFLGEKHVKGRVAPVGVYQVNGAAHPEKSKTVASTVR